MAPTVPLSVEGRTLLAHLDTGNTVSGVLVPKSFAEGLLHRRDAKVAGFAHTIGNTVPMLSVPIQGTATIGSTPLSASAVEYPNILPVGNIGSPALMHTVIEVDPLHQRVRVRREN
jgi:hypothetical protein